LTVHDGQGNPVASRSIVLRPNETLSGELSQLVGKDISGVSGGYLEGLATEPGVHTTLILGDSSEINIVNASGPFFSQTRWIPHFAVGGGYATEIDLVNVDTEHAATVLLSLFDDDGRALSGTSPTTVTIDPLAKKTITVSSLLGYNRSQVVSGSIRMDVQPIWLGPFSIIPNITGGIRFYNSSQPGFSTILSVDLKRRLSTVYPHVAQDLGYFTGLAVVNPQDDPVVVTVDVFNKTGTQVGSATYYLEPKGRISKLLYQLVPQSAGQVGGYFRIVATDDVYSIALFGDIAMYSLAAIPAQ